MAKNKTETTTKTTYVIHNDQRGRKPATGKLANSLRMVQPNEYFFTEATNQTRVHSLARSLQKTFQTTSVDNNVIRVTCLGNW